MSKTVGSASAKELDGKKASLLSAQWFARALSERDAHHRFSALANRLEQHSQLCVLYDSLQQAAVDERRHFRAFEAARAQVELVVDRCGAHCC